VLWWARNQHDRATEGSETGRDPVTFNRQIAPIVFKHCAPCHRPGQSAPFSLLTYEDTRRHSRQIVEVTARRFMPPWLPEPGYGEFAEPRILTQQEIRLIGKWATNGAPEGPPDMGPPLPDWPGGWQLGKPDLVVEMPESYRLGADGRDVYRNFVMPIPTALRRYVRDVEFRAGNNRVVHHAAMRVDRTRLSRRADEQDPGPGFGGMGMPPSTEAPGGHFLNWQPGKMPYRSPPELAWILDPDTDLVLQLHLHPSGREEIIQGSIGFYFTDRAPTHPTFKLILDSASIDIPPGKADYVIEDRYTLPVDADLRVVFPHAHYLAREMRAWAQFPDGTRSWLLFIKDWDLNWQGDYPLARPLFLPQGTTLFMRFTYDNSTANPRNPHSPPQRVVFGPESTDEMGEMWFQVVPRVASDGTRLQQDYASQVLRKAIQDYGRRVRANPEDAFAQGQLGRAFAIAGRHEEAQVHLQAAIKLRFSDDEAHYFLGLIHRTRQNIVDARQEFERTLQLNPAHYKAHGNLGMMSLSVGALDDAEYHFQSALRVHPGDAIAKQGLLEIRDLRAAGRKEP